MTSLIQGLEDDGLIARKEPAENHDRRFVRLYATKNGERRLHEARKERLDFIGEALEGLSDAEIQALSRTLDVLEPRVAALFSK